MTGIAFITLAVLGIAFLLNRGSDALLEELT